MFTLVPASRAGPFLEPGWKLQPWGFGVGHWASSVGSERPLEREAGKWRMWPAMAVLMLFQFMTFTKSRSLVAVRLGHPVSPAGSRCSIVLVHPVRGPLPAVVSTCRLPAATSTAVQGSVLPVPTIFFCLSPMLGSWLPAQLYTGTVHPSRHRPVALAPLLSRAELPVVSTWSGVPHPHPFPPPFL